MGPNSERRVSATVNLIRIIGSPFDMQCESPSGKEDAWELYTLARRNRIGLSFLDSLRRRKILLEMGLTEEYLAEEAKHLAQVRTLLRIAENLNNQKANYAVFKTIMPFPATPNDIDIIHFGNEKEFEKICYSLSKLDFIEVKGGADADQRMFHDSRLGGSYSSHPHEKDVYDTDIYQRISASHLIYFDKGKIQNKVIVNKIHGTEIRLLQPELELLIEIVHSIVPEMMCTLMIYYSTLHHVQMMDASAISRFLALSEENHVIRSVRTHMTIVSELHRAAHGFVPEAIEFILSQLKEVRRERKRFILQGLELPLRYDCDTLIRVLMEKTNEKTFSGSILSQVLFMTNYSNARWVLRNIAWRATRGSY